MKLYCKKYGILLAQDELESHKCLEKFEHLGKKGICPCLINAKTSEPFWKEVFEGHKEESTEGILDRTALAILRIKKAGLELQKEGMFNG